MATNPFGTLISGLNPDLNTPKFQFLNSYGANMSTPTGPKLGTVGNTSSVATTPKASYTASMMSSVPTNTPPAPVTPKVPTGSLGGNSSATTPKSAFIDSSVGANITKAADADTPGYSYVNGKLSTIGGKSADSYYAPPATDSNPTSLVNTNKDYNYGNGSKTTDTPTSTPQSNYADAFQTYLASLQPSSEELNLGKDLAGLRLQSQKDQDTALERPGQTNAFATGEAARVQRNNAYQIDAESNALDSVTAARTGRSNASKALLDYSKSLIPNEDPYTLSPGQTRYGPDGKPIASVPSAPGAPKIIGDSSTGYYTVGDDGKLTPLLGPAPKSLNETQSKQQAYAGINHLLTLADENGAPYVDNNGFMTPTGFKNIIQNAVEDGLDRSDILSQYGSLIYGPNAKAYGLTPKEIADLGFE